MWDRLEARRRRAVGAQLVDAVVASEAVEQLADVGGARQAEADDEMLLDLRRLGPAVISSPHSP